MLHLRLGRLVLRSHPSYVMWLPAGYMSPAEVHLVEYEDSRDGGGGQLGGFTSMGAAQACLDQLESEGWTDLSINLVPVHDRLSDWQFGR